MEEELLCHCRLVDTYRRDSKIILWWAGAGVRRKKKGHSVKISVQHQFETKFKILTIYSIKYTTTTENTSRVIFLRLYHFHQ